MEIYWALIIVVILILAYHHSNVLLLVPLVAFFLLATVKFGGKYDDFPISSTRELTAEEANTLDFGSQAENWYTMLHIAIWYKQMDIIELLSKRDGWKQMLTMQGQDGYAPLGLAMEELEFEDFKKFLSYLDENDLKTALTFDYGMDIFRPFGRMVKGEMLRQEEGEDIDAEKKFALLYLKTPKDLTFPNFPEETKFYGLFKYLGETYAKKHGITV